MLNSYVCVRGKDDAALEELNTIQEKIAQLVDGKYTIEQENRIQEYETNNRQIQGMMAISGSVALAYYLAWRGVRMIRLAEVLRDDTMM